VDKETTASCLDSRAIFLAGERDFSSEKRFSSAPREMRKYFLDGKIFQRGEICRGENFCEKNTRDFFGGKRSRRRPERMRANGRNCHSERPRGTSRGGWVARFSREILRWARMATEDGRELAEVEPDLRAGFACDSASARPEAGLHRTIPRRHGPCRRNGYPSSPAGRAMARLSLPALRQ
jgi:hypothetical protein